MASKKRDVPEIPSGAMADIAFLLLIFFLVTTTIEADKGIKNTLPPMPDPTVEPQIVNNNNNILFVKINRADQILADGKIIEIGELRQLCKDFIDNNGVNPDWSESPQKAIISLKNDVLTSYDMYLQVQNEMRAAYRELREAYSLETYDTRYDLLDDEKLNEINKNVYRMMISEAEPNVSVVN
ncbi:MAG: biopolymer transporter ExbD [Bacteroidetes bacterium]|nr:biopolymer transporter ExbD [Bacteroidota bacterium]